LLILVCTLAHCGPRLCGLSRKERWLEPDLEEGRVDNGKAPLIPGGNHIMKYPQ
jgi:hypothetical protein